MAKSKEQPIITRRECLKLFFLGGASLFLAPACNLTPEGEDFFKGLYPEAENPPPSPDISEDKAQKEIIAWEEQLNSQLDSIFIPTNTLPPFDPAQLRQAGDDFNSDQFQIVSVIDNLSAVSPDNILIPAAVLGNNFATSQGLEIARTALTGAKVNFDSGWLDIYHWLNHANQAGLGIYDMAAYARFHTRVIQQAISSGTILYRPETLLANNRTLNEVYMFIGEVNGHRWGTILNPNGAPVTGFNTGLKDGVYSAKEAVRYYNSQLRYAQPISPNQIPLGIKDNWVSKTPSTLQLLRWGLAYALKSQLPLALQQTQASFQTAVENLGQISTAPIIIVPVEIFCPQGTDFLPPACRPLPQS